MGNKKKKTRTNKKRGEVFDTIISFCASRITLQQLFQFSKLFKRFLSRNEKIHEMMKKYDESIKTTNIDNAITEALFKKKRIPNTFELFVAEYFDSANTQGWDAETNYLFLGCENQYDLCHKIYPFWSGSSIIDIYKFMESTEQIQGNYVIKEAEFGQLKHSLHVNDELALKLFHIIRFKIRTLSWKQIYNYFKFVLKMKYNVQRSVLKSKNAEDTTVSLDGIKMLLEIQLNDESKWLFQRVDSGHGSKVTWKEIGKYLRKLNNARDEMRDFFADNERDRAFEENQAEIVNSIHDNVESQAQKSESLEEKLLAQLHSISDRLAKLEKKIAAKPSAAVPQKPLIQEPPSKVKSRISMQSMAKSISLASPSEVGYFEDRIASIPKTASTDISNIEPLPEVFDASEYV